ncbi:MAG: NAD-dependent malic enzyme [Paracoccus sp. (in: a-proteobacteria)]|uniref:NAD-dependent malic enzyme n=1 Tax=Paracoccus sp. TaxID=267 RepID=UPI0026DEF799|nr:NAD-dependent malic enzyme [Paracoccus sp. (in: a-proteobacteria)]MDO5622717.1 NAD-dependent malic enzyme [Paracoccus sp. (in: a-proteobacteria)]
MDPAHLSNQHRKDCIMTKRPEIITDPLTNKGTAFSHEERAKLGLTGRLPAGVETLDQQAARAYAQLSGFETDLEKYIYLDQLHDRNEVLYYRVILDHLSEMLPIVYDPTIGEAIKKWSRDYRQSRAVYLSIDRPEDVKASFETLGLGPDDVDLIVVSDAQEILGIGDWGVNGTDISVGKLAVYTAAAGIDPARVIAVNLDVGTDNEQLLNDPAYLGNRHARITGKRYDDLIDLYLKTASEMFPKALLHFEDFGPSNARRILVNNRDKYRIFNDDMQGTGAIVISSVVSGLKVTKQNFADQRLVVYGAGTAGTGMADQIHAAMMRDGLSAEEAKARVWLIDINGLVTDDMKDLPDYQQAYARPASEVADWTRHDGKIGLQTVVEQVKPTILIGTSTDHNAFTEGVIKAMAAGVDRPIILPLSNPTEKIEAMPADIIPWTEGRALIATGIPIDPITYNGTTYHIGQANNALLYPGLGLGVVVSGATHVTDGMLLAAAEAVASQVDPTGAGASLLPDVSNLRASSATVAVAVAKQAVRDGVAKPKDNLVQAVQDAMWQPVYK